MATSKTHITALFQLTAIALVAGLLPALAHAQQPSSLVGTWLMRTDQLEVRAQFRADGTFTRATRTAVGTETIHGTYRDLNGTVELKAQGMDQPLRLKYRLADANTLELTDDQGKGVRMVRQDAAAPPIVKPATPPAENPPPKTGGVASSQPGAATRPAGPPVTFVAYHLIDEGDLRDPGTNQWLEVFQIMLPKGWKFQGGVRWMAREKRPEQLTKTDTLMPSKFDWSAASPDGLCMLRQFPVEYWVDTSRVTTVHFALGANYNGMIVCPVTSPEKYIAQFVIPRQRGGKLQDLKLVNEEDQPKLAEKYAQESADFSRAMSAKAAEGTLTFKAGSVTVDYSEGGAAHREMFVAIVQYMDTAGMVMWWPRMLYSMRAPRENFEAMRPQFVTMIASTQMNVRWCLALADLNQQASAAQHQTDAYIHKVQKEIAQSHAQTNQELARASGYLSSPMHSYKGTDGNSYWLPTDKYHFMNKDGNLLSQDSWDPPSSEWQSIEPYNEK